MEPERPVDVMEFPCREKKSEVVVVPTDMLPELVIDRAGVEVVAVPATVVVERKKFPPRFANVH